MKYRLDSKGLEQAIARNPAKVRQEVGVFLVRGRAMYMSTINGSPWRVGSSGGGVPINVQNVPGKGNLKAAHQETMSPWQWKVDVNQRQAPYAGYVHDGTRKMGERPWLDHAINTNSSRLEQHQIQLLESIVNDLAR